MIKPMLRLLLPFLLLLPALDSQAYNRAFEQKISRQLVESLGSDDEFWLRSGNTEFLGLYRDYETDQPQGAVILVHGMGAHADWPEVIRPLRMSLPKIGWATLSIQMPVMSPTDSIADYGMTMPESRRRIQAAVRQLLDWRYLNIVIIGHSFGAATSAHALAAKDLQQVKAFVGISMQAQPFLNPRLKLLKELEALSIPVLDIYASRDRPEVLREVDDRRLAARKSGNQAYTQAELDGADHYFTGMDEVLLKRIQGWLIKASPGSRVRLEEQGADPTKQGSVVEE